MSKLRIDIGVACSGGQLPQWWNALIGELLFQDRGVIEIGEIYAISSALPDHNKNHALGSGVTFAPDTEKRRNELTDANRVSMSKAFLDGRSDAIMMIDDDTVIPQGTIGQLAELEKGIAAGVYYNAKPPYNPIAYKRDDDGLYWPVNVYMPGQLMEVDSVGMGCTLIRREVFEAIRDNFIVYQRQNGSLFPVHKDAVFGEMPKDIGQVQNKRSGGVYVMNGIMCQSVTKWQGDDRRWPFFALEYGRTEDHYFCELADQVGYKPWLDTTINCVHLKTKGTTREDYKTEVFTEYINPG